MRSGFSGCKRRVPVAARVRVRRLSRSDTMRHRLRHRPIATVGATGLAGMSTTAKPLLSDRRDVDRPETADQAGLQSPQSRSVSWHAGCPRTVSLAQRKSRLIAGTCQCPKLGCDGRTRPHRLQQTATTAMRAGGEHCLVNNSSRAVAANMTLGHGKDPGLPRGRCRGVYAIGSERATYCCRLFRQSTKNTLDFNIMVLS
jgi:hypothetical protein